MRGVGTVPSSRRLCLDHPRLLRCRALPLIRRPAGLAEQRLRPAAIDHPVLSDVSTDDRFFTLSLPDDGVRVRVRT